MNKIFIYIVYVALIAVGVRCGGLDNLAGGGTDVSNPRISGKVVTGAGLPAAETVISVRKSSFNQLVDGSEANVHIDTTDSNGWYSIAVPAYGAYTMTAVQRNDLSRAMIAAIPVEGSNVEAPVSVLRIPGAIHLAVPAFLLHRNDGYLYIPGTPFAAMAGNQGEWVTIDSVPAGVIPEIRCGTLKPDETRAVRYGVPVASSATTIIVKTDWLHAKKITVNTTPAPGGAGLTSPLYGFPLLIRLTEANFDFSEAAPQGADVRFTDAAGLDLPFEIEQWDEALKQAAIWVRLDTLWPNSVRQSFTMYWGTPGGIVQTSPSDGGAVFDVSAGYAAVLHMDRDCRDATNFGRHGVNFGAADAAGVMGRAKKFDGADSVRIASLCGMPGCLTISAWAKLDSATSGQGRAGAEVVSLGNAAILRMDDSAYAAPNGTIGSFSGDSLSSVLMKMYGTTTVARSDSLAADSLRPFIQVRSGRMLKKGDWQYLAYVIDTVTSTQSLYINGVLVKTNHDSRRIVYENTAAFTCIGIHGKRTLPFQNNFNFIGSIDEVRIYSRALSANEVKACYMNQRRDDKLVVIE